MHEKRGEKGAPHETAKTLFQDMNRSAQNIWCALFSDQAAGKIVSEALCEDGEMASN